MGVAAEHDGLAGCQQGAHPAALIGPGILAVSKENPPVVAGAVVGENGAVDHHEGVPGAPGAVKEVLNLLRTGVAEVNHDIGVGARVEQEVGVMDVHAQLPAHAGGHVLVIGLGYHGVVVAAEVVVARHRHKRAVRGQAGLEKAHGVVQKALVDFRRGGVSLHQVS